MRLRNSRRTRLLGAATLLIPLLVLAACSGSDPQNTLAPQGHIAAVTSGLFWPVFWVAVGVFVLVEGLLVISLIVFRSRRGRQLPVQVHGNSTLEITWTAIPALMLLGVAIPTVATLVHVDTTPANAMEINVIGHQWWWEFDYPQEGIVTADELHIPAGVPVHVSLHSDDVIHSFWVPVLVGKQDVIPNHDGGMWFSAYKPGTYDGQCAQFCGEQHALMQFRVVAQSQDDFNTWLAGQQASAVLSPSTRAGLQGDSSIKDPAADAFFNNGCIGCHTINGTNAKGTVGPNLTHFASRASFEELGSHMMDNNPDNVRRWITDPQGIKPGNDMKIGSLSSADVQALVNMLQGLK
ncbi:MAG TPA: cytochrome c oxidase subunit II [Dehalococcoidia bacterium]|nr:cytochrome c oxidase subunit II [Dehalococcoidia bacterium]